MPKTSRLQHQIRTRRKKSVIRIGEFATLCSRGGLLECRTFHISEIESNLKFSKLERSSKFASLVGRQNAALEFRALTFPIIQHHLRDGQFSTRWFPCIFCLALVCNQVEVANLRTKASRSSVKFSSSSSLDRRQSLISYRGFDILSFGNRIHLTCYEIAKQTFLEAVRHSLPVTYALASPMGLTLSLDKFTRSSA